jgi:hypothetical protein
MGQYALVQERQRTVIVVATGLALAVTISVAGTVRLGQVTPTRVQA